MSDTLDYGAWLLPFETNWERQQLDWSLIIFISIVIFFSYRGYKKGLLKSLCRVLSLLAGYISAILYSSKVASIIELNFEIQGIAGFITASLLLFISAAFAVNVLIKLIERIWPSKDEPSVLSAYSGATAGAIVGIFIAIALVWTFSFTRDMRAGALPKKGNSPIETLSRRVASNAVKTALSLGKAEPEIARLSAALIESPAEITQQAKRLSRSEDLSQLMNDPNILAALNAGNVNAVQKSSVFQQLAKNSDLQALAKSAGLLHASDGDVRTVEAALASRITEIWGRTQQVKNDKRVQEIFNNPDFLRNMQSGNPIDLFTDSSLLELADIILSDNNKSVGTTKKNTTNAQSKKSAKNNLEKKARLYSWTDDNGVIHVSDVDPES